MALGFLRLSFCFQVEIINFDPNRRDLRRGGESGDLARILFSIEITVGKNSRKQIRLAMSFLTAPAQEVERKFSVFAQLTLSIF